MPDEAKQPEQQDDSALSALDEMLSWSIAVPPPAAYELPDKEPVVADPPLPEMDFQATAAAQPVQLPEFTAAEVAAIPPPPEVEISEAQPAPESPEAPSAPSVTPIDPPFFRAAQAPAETLIQMGDVEPPDGNPQVPFDDAGFRGTELPTEQLDAAQDQVRDALDKVLESLVRHAEWTTQMLNSHAARLDDLDSGGERRGAY